MLSLGDHELRINRSSPNASPFRSVGPDQGIGFQAPTRSTFGDGIPRRLEDWRIPKEKCTYQELRQGATRGQPLNREQPLGQTWS